VVRLKDGAEGSVTIGGTVSPAGGNFEEPVTQATLKVVGAFHGLSRDRAEARKFPSIDPLDSWSKYSGIISPKKTEFAQDLLFRGNEVGQMMKVVGEEGTSLDDYIVNLKSEFLDSVYIQQNSFDPVDAAVSVERQNYVFDLLFEILGAKLSIESKEEARSFFNQLRQRFIDWNYSEWQSDEFKKSEETIRGILNEKFIELEDEAKRIQKAAESEE
jgi:V/A-type H+-transporting ATPase subunit A